MQEHDLDIYDNQFTDQPPQMSDTIQSAEAFVDLLREGGYSAPFFLSVEDADKKVEERDAAIRADEARNQAERYAACVEAVRRELQFIKIECKYALKRGFFTNEEVDPLAVTQHADKALDDLEATK